MTLLNDPDGATTVGCFVLLILAFSKKKKKDWFPLSALIPYYLSTVAIK